MTMETLAQPTTEEGMARTEAFVDRLMGSYIAGAELLTIELGRRLGLYDALRDVGPCTYTGLAEHAGIPARYAQEWLDQQAAAGIVDVVVGRGDERRFLLSDAYVPVLLEEVHPAHMMGLAPVLLGVARALPAVADAYATGRGVHFADFGDELRFGLGSLNRPGFAHDTRAWIEAMPDVAARLDTGGTILDAGCGVGWSTIGLAQAFPCATIVGIDLDAESIVEARANAVNAGVADRVSFVEGNAADERALRPDHVEAYALITVYQALHDMGEPIQALTAFAAVLAEDGVVLVGDEHGSDELEAPAGDVERLQLAVSVLHCLPATWAESDRIVNGTVLRGATMREWVRAAGFDRLEVLDIEHSFWRFYRLG